MTPLVRCALARAFILLISLSVLAGPASAQFGFQPPTGPATASCNPFTGFPLSLNLGQRADGLDGISSRCGFQRVQDGLNLLAGQRAQPNGIATLDGNGLLPLSQLPATGYLPGAVPSLIVTGQGSTGLISGMSALATGAVTSRTFADQFADIAWLPNYKAPSDPDWTNAFNAAIATGKEVYVPAGSYTVGTGGAKVILLTGTTIRGAGRGLTTIKLANGANVDVLQTQGAYGLFGSQAEAGVLRWKVTDLTIDGNRAFQSTPPGVLRDSVNCIAAYGAAWTIHNVILQNCLGNGLRTEHAHGGGANDDLVLDVSKLTIDTVGRNGWDFAGPHDGNAITVEVIDAGQDADNTFFGVKAYASGAAKWFNFHGWHRAATTNRVAYQFSGIGSNIFTTSDFEGGRGQFYSSGNDRVTGSQFYSHFGAPGSAMVVLSGGGGTFTGNAFFNDTNADAYALQIGTAASGLAVQSITESTFSSFVTRGPVNFVNDGGANRITGMGYAAPGGPTTIGGSISPLSTVDLSIQGQGLEVHQTSPRPWKDFTPVVSSSGGTLGAASGSIRWTKNGNSVTLSGTVTVTDAGTATGLLRITFPQAPRNAGSVNTVNNSDGQSVYGALTSNGMQSSIPSSGKTLAFSTTYETY